MMWWVGLALADPGARFALVAGANDGGPGRGALRYAVSDAQAVGDVLTELGGVPDDHLVRLSEPSPAGLRAALVDLGDRVRQAGEGTAVVVYYSGHSDRHGLQLGGEVYPWEALRDDLRAAGGSVQIAIVDGCASGHLVRAKGGTAAPAFLASETVVEGRAWLTSSSADELSQEADHVGGSFFTHALVTGLRGAADYDGDARVTLREVHQFAAEETLARTERTRLGAQHPAYDLRIKGQADVVLTDVQRPTSQLRLDPSLQGRLYLRDSDGRLVAELPLRREAVDLALPAGRYRAVLEQDGALSEGTVALSKGRIAVLGASDLLPVRGEVTLARGRLYADVPVAVTLFPYLTSDGLDARDQLHWTALGVVAVHGARLQGVSLGTVATTYRDGVDGVQIGGVFAHTGGLLRGGQLSLGLNDVRGDLVGVQVGPMNLARRVRGLQLGVVNGTRDLRGVGVGLVQVASTARGVPVALLPLIGDGMHHVGVWTATDAALSVGAQLGSRVIYTAYVARWDPARNDLTAALGFGGRVRRGGVRVDVDALAGMGGRGTSPTFRPALRLVVGWPLRDEHLAPFVLGRVGLDVPTGGATERVRGAIRVSDRVDVVPAVGAGLRW